MNQKRRRILKTLSIFLNVGFAFFLQGAEPVPPKKTETDSKKVFDLFGDISKNMSLIEKMLNQKESGKKCQEKQRNLLKQMDKLIEGLQSLQKSSGSGSGSSNSKGKQGGSQQKKGDQKAEKTQRKVQEKGPGKPNQGEQLRKGRKGKKESNKKTGKDQKRVKDQLPPIDKTDGKGRNGNGGWGFLPGEVKALLRSQGRTGIPLKYAEIIRRYFKRLSEGNNK